MTKIFVTGATGYIGGDALYVIANAHQEYEITCLVRKSDKDAVQIAAQYSKIKLVYGDLDDADLMKEESRKADIVCHFANANHVASASAIAQGLLAGHDASQPGFFIYTSGTGILAFEDIQNKTYGGASDTVYDDLEGVADVTSLPDSAPHRDVDKLVLTAGTEHAETLKTAVVCPPTIYGQGRGPGNKRSHQVPELARCTLERGHGIQVNEGKTRWGNVHVHDLSDLYLKLVENAAAGGGKAERTDVPAMWGAEGYYFSENGEHVWGEVSQWMATEAQKQGWAKTDEVKSISADEAAKCARAGQVLWGANSRARAKRAKAVLKWEPNAPSLKDEIKEVMQLEAHKLGLTPPSHAAVAAGDA